MLYGAPKWFIVSILGMTHRARGRRGVYSMLFDLVKLVKVKFELKCGAAAEVAHHYIEGVSLISFIMSHAALRSMF
jgi:hypothetical protein